VDDANPSADMAALEQRVLQAANTLDIGPMGFGGKLTVGGCKVGVRNRLPASFFVSVAYMCWAYRRRGVVLDTSGEVVEWLYQGGDESFERAEPTASEPALLDLGSPGSQAPVITLNAPLTEADVRKLKAGDIVLVNGPMFTGRDAVHKYLHSGGAIDVLKNAIIYHCGPVVLEEGGQYRVVAAGPTTSIREEPYQAAVIEKYGVKAVIGKGGMGVKPREACKKFGCVYLHAIGGAAQIYAQCIERVPRVFLKDRFGSPEAVWELHVKNFPAVVTMDAHGRSLHAEVSEKSNE